MTSRSHACMYLYVHTQTVRASGIRTRVYFSRAFTYMIHVHIGHPNKTPTNNGTVDAVVMSSRGAVAQRSAACSREAYIIHYTPRVLQEFAFPTEHERSREREMKRKREPRPF